MNIDKLETDGKISKVKLLHVCRQEDAVTS